MYSFKDIKERSESADKLVVSYTDAMELLYIYKQESIQVLGWEGWLQYDNGVLGPSKKYQGTTDLSSMPKGSAIALVQSSIMQAHTEWEERPEANNASLVFYIITSTYKAINQRNHQG